MLQQLEFRRAVARVQRMELYFDIVQDALRNDPDSLHRLAPLREILEVLTRYYEGGQWLSDYQRDERGELPKDLKRGVLSQDGLYDLLCEIGQQGY